MKQDHPGRTIRRNGTGLAIAGLAAILWTAAVAAQGAASTPEAETPVQETEVLPGTGLTRSSPFLPEIYTFLVEDEVLGTEPCGTLFLGSSSIRFWFTLADDFPGRRVVRRGFGGSQIAHSTAYFDLIVAPHRPREIVFYAGENDLHAGLSPEQVRDALLEFLAVKTDRLGAVPVYYVSIKPTRARWGEIEAQRVANGLIRDLAGTRSDLVYIDVATPMLDDGLPRDIFISDDLHMTLDGYAIWQDVIARTLDAPSASMAPHCR